jgi:hypothetical protein
MPEDYFFDDAQEPEVSNTRCPFCGRSKDGGIDDHDFWEPTECSHACCQDCARPQFDEKSLEPLLYSLCPTCDLATVLKN